MSLMDTTGAVRRGPRRTSRPDDVPARVGLGAAGARPGRGVRADRVLRSRQVDVPFRDPHGKLFRAKLLSTAETLLVFVPVDIVVRWPLAEREARSCGDGAPRWTPYRIGMIALALVSYQVVCLSYRNLKSWDVFRTPHDAMLLRWDRWLFFGHSPAVLLHDLLGRDSRPASLTDWSRVVLDASPTLPLVAALAFTPTRAVGVRLRGLGDVGLDHRRRFLLPDPVARALPRRRGVRRAPAHLHPVTQGPTSSSAPICWRTPRPSTPSPRSRRSPACTGADHPDLADGSLLRAARAVVGRRRCSWPSRWWRRSTWAGTSPSTTSPASRSPGSRCSSGNSWSSVVAVSASPRSSL